MNWLADLCVKGKIRLVLLHVPTRSAEERIQADLNTLQQGELVIPRNRHHDKSPGLRSLGCRGG
jgi:hypothetical protein